MAVNSQCNWCWRFDLKRCPGERAPFCPRFSFGHWCSPLLYFDLHDEANPGKEYRWRKRSKPIFRAPRSLLLVRDGLFAAGTRIRTTASGMHVMPLTPLPICMLSARWGAYVSVIKARGRQNRSRIFRNKARRLGAGGVWRQSCRARPCTARTGYRIAAAATPAHRVGHPRCR